MKEDGLDCLQYLNTDQRHKRGSLWSPVFFMGDRTWSKNCVRRVIFSLDFLDIILA